MKSNRPTLMDVAELAGVTAATASRVLNNKQKFSASPAVRARIIEAATQLGYAPDLAARNLNRQHTNIIGVFASPKAHVAEGIYGVLLEGIAEVLGASEYDVFFGLSTSQKRAMPFWRFDGALLLQSPDPKLVEELDRRRVPYLCINEILGNPLAYVLADDRMGMRSAVDHLHQLGHRKIAYANARAIYLTHYSVSERHNILMKTTEELKMTVVRGHDQPFLSAQAFLQASVINEKATAVITYDHHIAVMIIGAAEAMNLRVPRDFSLICFNDLFPVSYMSTPITAVGVSGHEMGRIGAGLLLKHLTMSSTPLLSKEVRVPEELVLRQSTAPLKATTPRP